MKTLIKIFKCKVLGIHTIDYRPGYGYRCDCCGKTKAEIDRGKAYGD